ncbi:MAG: hypothetical protein K2N16_01835 [Muribaculaceae bacterium]|nr:hypothetical protein [Muribaculaceae bacterium]
MTPRVQITTATKIKQNICGCIGILMCLFLLCYHTGRIFNLFDPTVYYMLPSSVCEVVAYIVLFSLASNIASEIFSVAQIAVEIFFAIALPLMLTHVGEMQSLDKWIFVTFVTFCMLSLYFWVVLFNNNKFHRRDLWWIMLLPLLQALEMCIYLSYLSHIKTVTDFDNPAFCVPDNLRIVKICLVLLLPVSWWKISHSSAFSGPKDGLSMPSFSIWNRFGLICGLMAAVASISFFC